MYLLKNETESSHGTHNKEMRPSHVKITQVSARVI